MKILQLCKKIPYPPKDGETIAISTLTKGFAKENHEVTVLATATQKHNFDLAQLPEDWQQVAVFDSVYVNTKVSVFDALANLFTDQSYNIYRFYTAKFKGKIVDYLKKNKYDIIQLEGIYLASYIPTIRQYSDAPIVLRSHNIEFEIWERMADEQKHFLKRLYMRLLAKRLRAFEVEKLSDYDAIVPISSKDEAYYKALGFRKPMLTIPASMDLSEMTAEKEESTTIAIDASENKALITTDAPQTKSLFFIGSLDWMPNQQALIWFLEKVWPDLLSQFPALQVYVAGRHTPDWLYEKSDANVHILGEVADAPTFMKEHDIMVVPLFSGSGMRVKIIEAMALGKAIVATNVAAEGISCSDRKEIMIADEAQDFVAAIAELLTNSDLEQQIGDNARHFALKHHDTTTLVKNLLTFYEKNLLSKM